MIREYLKIYINDKIIWISLGFFFFHILTVIAIYIIIFHMKDDIASIILLVYLNLINLLLLRIFIMGNFLFLIYDPVEDYIYLIILIFLSILYIIGLKKGIPHIILLKYGLILILILTGVSVYILIYLSKIHTPHTTIFNLTESGKIFKILRFLSKEELLAHAKEYCVINNLNLKNSDIEYAVKMTRTRRFEYTMKILNDFHEYRLKESLNAEHHSIFSIALGFGTFSLVIGISFLIYSIFN